MEQLVFNQSRSIGLNKAYILQLLAMLKEGDKPYVVTSNKDRVIRDFKAMTGRDILLKNTMNQDWYIPELREKI